ncbi:hypothetical protein F0250_23010 [Vibrio cyclitrophicus]|uniref:hypothetical protein n=1 Tax=Vibrio cyclitrophicus TaxID=47951 RepID=UPI00148E4BCE|nr:hypothetical protein [Vibrio cyclitrophicus]NOI36743.1 hypothetical protein [Vibrio cyclitrophicus]
MSLFFIFIRYRFQSSIAPIIQQKLVEVLPLKQPDTSSYQPEEMMIKANKIAGIIFKIIVVVATCLWAYLLWHIEQKSGLRSHNFCAAALLFVSTLVTAFSIYINRDPKGNRKLKVSNKEANVILFCSVAALLGVSSFFLWFETSSNLLMYSLVVMIALDAYNLFNEKEKKFAPPITYILFVVSVILLSFLL